MANTQAPHPPGLVHSPLEMMQFILSGNKFDLLALSQKMDTEYGAFNLNIFASVYLYMISDPALAQEVLVTRSAEFAKDRIFKRAFQPMMGNGLLLSEGDFWKKQSKLVRPAFHHHRIGAYAETMVEHTQKLMAGWQSGDTLWIDREMMKLTLTIVNKTLFDVDISAKAERIGELMHGILKAGNANINAVFALPKWFPAPKRLGQQKLIREIDEIINGFIAERRASGEDRGDLLSMLLAARDEDGNPMSELQLRDEVRTLFLAGHETTANTLTFALYLLALHPEVVQTLRQELDTVLVGRAPTLADLPNLPYSEMIIKETMRLYPAASAVTRTPLADTTIAGYPVKKNASLQISIYAMHRSPRFWDDPDAFDPQRFTPENEKRIPKYVYMPFSAGPRVCIGNQFAMMEARLALVTIMQQWDVVLDPTHPVSARQMMTLRPANGVRMTVTARQTESAMAY